MTIYNELLTILDEISRQLISSKPKIIFTLPETYKTVKMATEIAKQSVEVVTIKYGSSQDVHSDAINFTELIDTSGTVTFTHNLPELKIDESNFQILTTIY